MTGSQRLGRTFSGVTLLHRAGDLPIQFGACATRKRVRRAGGAGKTRRMRGRTQRLARAESLRTAFASLALRVGLPLSLPSLCPVWFIRFLPPGA